LSLTLYFHPLSSFCHKVLVALYENDTEFDRRIINLGDDKERAELLAVSPIGRFPAIRDHVRKRDVAETTIIIEYLDHFFAGERALVPREWEDAFQVRLWDRLFDNYLQVPVQQIVGDRIRGTHADLTRERATLDTAYGMIDNQMADRTGLPAGTSAWPTARLPRHFFTPAPSNRSRNDSST
jgi:glutathione S-transferase